MLLGLPTVAWPGVTWSPPHAAVGPVLEALVRPGTVYGPLGLSFPFPKAGATLREAVRASGRFTLTSLRLDSH